MTTSSPQELLAKFDLHPRSTEPGRYYVTCPKCSAKRSTKAHQEAKCLGITIDDSGACWGCSHCGWTGPPRSNGQAGDIVATYDYRDEAGDLLFQKVRKAPKDFLLRRPDGHGGWIWSVKDVRKVIYRLPEVIEAIASEHTVLCVEGEKDVNNLWAIGIPATCNPDGASEPDKKPKWYSEYSEQLRGADIVVIPDNDPSGYAHAEITVKMSLGMVKRVRYLDLAKHWPECPKGGDVSDWLAAGHTREQLDALIDAAPPWERGADNYRPDDISKNQKPTIKSVIKTAAELRTMTFAPLKYIVPGLIVEGLVLLAGKPKVKKSWMALDIALSVAEGHFCLGDRRCQQGDVLYLALEDGDRRLQRRIKKLLPTFGSEWPDRFHYTTQWLRADQGGVEEIDQWCDGHPDARLIVIDILAKFRAPSRGKNNAYEQDYEALLKLQELATRRSITILVIHHTRKGESEDPAEEISGTLGLSGSADAFLVLKRTNSGATLVGRGRDLEDVDLALQFSNETCRWTILGAASEIHRSAERGRILAALEGALDGLSPSEVADITGLTRTNSRQLLIRMAKGNKILKTGRGRYFHPSVTPPVTSVTLSPSAIKPNETERYTDEKSDSDKVTAVTGGTLPHVLIPGGHEPRADFNYPELPAFLDRRARP
jgi:hypothetical protein